MKLTAEIGDSTSEVELTRDGDMVTARVDDRTMELRVSSPEPGVVLIQSEGSVWEVAVSDSGPNAVLARFNGREIAVRLYDPKRLRNAIADGGATAGRAEIRTAMPGKVVRLLKKPGASVRKGEGVIVVEAMKMQNEIKAPHDGTVSEVRVGEGDTVGGGDILMILT